MAINFPNAPSSGQVYEFGDYTYTFDGVKWTSILRYGLAAAKVSSETPPPNPEAGLMWYVPSTGESYLYYVDEDGGQWIQENPSIGAVAHGLLEGVNEVGGHDSIYRRATTVAEIASGVFTTIPSYFEVSDRGGAKFDLLGVGTPNGYDIIAAGGDNVATLSPNDTRLESFGAGAFNSGDAIQRALDTVKNVTFSSEVWIEKDIWIKNNGGIVGSGAAKLVTKSNARVRCEKWNEFRGFNSTAQYYNDPVDPATPQSLITVNAVKGAFSLTVANSTGFAVGDYVFVFNGYCDHYRQLEQGSDPSLFNSDAVDLAGGEIQKIRSIAGNVLTLEAPVFWDYPVVPKLYGGLAGENTQAAYSGFNTPRVTRLDFTTVTIKDFEIDDTAGSSLGFFNQVIDLEHLGFSTIQNIKVNGKRTILLNNKAYRNNISNIKSNASIGNTIRLENFATSNNVDNVTAEYKEGKDAAVLVNLRGYKNNLSNITVEGTYSTNKNTIGVYLNGSIANNVSNVSGSNVQALVAVMFDCYSNNVNNIAGTNVGNIILSYYARRNTYNGYKLDGSTNVSVGGGEYANLLCFASKDETFDNGSIYSSADIAVKQQFCERVTFTKLKSKGQGKSFAILGSVQLSGAVITDCDLDSTLINIEITHTNPDDTSVLPINITQNKMNSVYNVQLTSVKNVNITNNPKMKSTGNSLRLSLSSFYTFTGNGCVGNGTNSAIQFEGSTNSRYLSSHGLVENNTYQNVLQKFNLYSRPSFTKTGGVKGTRMLMLDVYPAIEEYVYTASSDNGVTPADWTKVTRV